MGKLEGKVAWVSGAGSGIGRASALRMAEEGAALMCVDLNEDAAKDTAAQIAERGGQSAAVRADVTAEEQVRTALQRAVDELGGLHIIFNNAGGTSPDNVPSAWDGGIALNLSGVYYGLAHGCELLAQRGGGAVISTSSIAGLGALVGTGAAAAADDPERAAAGVRAYVAAKHGVVGLTRQFAIDYGQRGVRVNAINPGYIRTPLLQRIDDVPEAVTFLESLHPMGRLGKPEEIAAAAVFLASDDASFITGITLPVDGGYSAR